LDLAPGDTTEVESGRVKSWLGFPESVLEEPGRESPQELIWVSHFLMAGKKKVTTVPSNPTFRIGKKLVPAKD
jgi:hypothetical protein